jgi:hypothetical protein
MISYSEFEELQHKSIKGFGLLLGVCLSIGTPESFKTYDMLTVLKEQMLKQITQARKEKV